MLPCGNRKNIHLSQYLTVYCTYRYDNIQIQTTDGMTSSMYIPQTSLMLSVEIHEKEPT